MKDGMLRIPCGAVRQHPWRYLFLFIVIYFGSIGITIFLAPMVQKLLWIYHFSNPSPWTNYLVRKPFGKIFDRTCWIPLFFGIFYLLKKTRLLSLRRLGICWKYRGQWLIFFVLGALLSLVICLAQLATTQWTFGEKSAASILAKAVGSAFLVSTLEEIVFRALIPRLIYNAAGAIFALIISSAFFAHVHFKIPSDVGNFYGASISISQSSSVGLAYLTSIGASFRCIPYFSLLALGGLLVMLNYRFSNLMASMGFHCGLVFILLLYRGAIHITADSTSKFLGSNQLIDSPLALLLLWALFFYQCSQYFRQCSKI
ncbi:MAG: CPBP family intramembrane metalloprotease [Puniceicoccales bacterium]|nr:CPBP family intramembrane metalloprotease [Puniceicoccales bacterium]